MTMRLFLKPRLRRYVRAWPSLLRDVFFGAGCDDLWNALTFDGSNGREVKQNMIQ